MSLPRHHVILSCCALLLLTGCGDGPAPGPAPNSAPNSAPGKDGSKAGTAAAGQPSNNADDPADGPAAGGGNAGGAKAGAGLPVAFALPRVVSLGAVASRSMVVEAVYGASQLSGAAAQGQVVSVGTITVGPQGAQYQPNPTDKLVVKLGEQTHEFVLKQANGNSQAADATNWLMAPHVLQYTHRIPEQAEAAVSVQFDGSRFNAKIAGWINAHGQRYDVELATAGQTVGDRGFDGQDTKTQYTLTGKISGNGIEVEVSETHAMSLASAISPRLLPSQRGSASRFNATINSTLRCDGDTYKFEGVQVQTDRKEKGQQESSTTELAGVISRNGAPFANCGARGGVAFAVAGGKTIRLDAPN